MNQFIHVQAHRGASFEKRENSIESIQRALEIGADSIEIDLHLLKDGSFVVFHDFKVTFPGNPKNFICELTQKEMKLLGAPSLAEVFKATKSVGTSKLLWLDLELKYQPEHPSSPSREEIVEKLLKDIALEWNLSRTKFRSFDWEILRVVQRSVSSLQTIPLIGANESDLEKAMQLQPEWIAMDSRGVSEQVISKVHRSGMKLMPYTVNTNSLWKQLRDWGVDGITTDDPRGLLRFLGRSS